MRFCILRGYPSKTVRAWLKGKIRSCWNTIVLALVLTLCNICMKNLEIYESTNDLRGHKSTIVVWIQPAISLTLKPNAFFPSEIVQAERSIRKNSSNAFNRLQLVIYWKFTVFDAKLLKDFGRAWEDVFSWEAQMAEEDTVSNKEEKLWVVTGFFFWLHQKN